jgi:hypothetical protein
MRPPSSYELEFTVKVKVSAYIEPEELVTRVRTLLGKALQNHDFSEDYLVVDTRSARIMLQSARRLYP